MSISMKTFVPCYFWTLMMIRRWNLEKLGHTDYLKLISSQGNGFLLFDHFNVWQKENFVLPQLAFGTIFLYKSVRLTSCAMLRSDWKHTFLLSVGRSQWTIFLYIRTRGAAENLEGEVAKKQIKKQFKKAFTFKKVSSRASDLSAYAARTRA